MKSLMKVGFVVLAITISTPLFGAIVYDNSVNDRTNRFEPGTLEVGDEITLAGTERNLTRFDFEYWGTSLNNGVSFAGNVKAQVRFYLNNGPLTNGFASPGFKFYDSGLFTLLPTPPNATGRQTLIFLPGADNIPITGIILPNSFTWTVQFSGLTNANDHAGVDIYSPPVLGGNHNDYWQNDPTGWSLKANANTNLNSFGARFFANNVPDVANTFQLLGGAMALLFGFRLRKR